MYVRKKRRVKESIPPMTNKNRDQVPTDKEKAEVPNNIFCFSVH